MDLDNAHCSVEKYQSSIALFDHLNRDCDWVFLGDSITNAGRWNELFPAQRVSNQGIDGDTVKGMVGRSQYVINMNPKTVFILSGINDIIQKRHTDCIIEQYQQLIGTLIQSGCNVVIQSTLLTGDLVWNEGVIELNNKLKQICHKLGITFLDLNRPLGFEKSIDHESTYDGVHLQPHVYIKWQKAIMDYVHNSTNQSL
ncbi:GDSL-type esterase/lipase family protein [Vibrio pomeroyi]|uniref:GDSL-type esterase/lipase family protein n=1 Tax=Vibrio pomeroyi TaxID=198832 RepID=A0ABV4N548_9VIBR